MTDDFETLVDNLREICTKPQYLSWPDQNLVPRVGEQEARDAMLKQYNETAAEVTRQKHTIGRLVAIMRDADAALYEEYSSGNFTSNVDLSEARLAPLGLTWDDAIEGDQ